MKKSLAALATLALGLAGAGTAQAAQQLYFKNSRVMEITSYEIKPPLIYITLTDGSVVIMREATVDWEGTNQITSSDVVLRQGEYDTPRPAASAGGTAGGPSAPIVGKGTLTSTELKGFRGALRRAAASKSGDALQVYASRGWTDTGVDVRNQDLVLLATGRAYIAPELSVGPAGESSGAGRGTPLIVSFPWGALIGKIGDGGTPFLVGSRLNLAPHERGRLYLTVNDRNTADNKGSIEVQVQGAGAAGGGGRSGSSARSWGGQAAASPATPGSSAPAAPARQQPGMAGSIDKARSVRDSLPGN